MEIKGKKALMSRTNKEAFAVYLEFTGQEWATMNDCTRIALIKTASQPEEGPVAIRVEDSDAVSLRFELLKPSHSDFFGTEDMRNYRNKRKNEAKETE